MPTCESRSSPTASIRRPLQPLGSGTTHFIEIDSSEYRKLHHHEALSLQHSGASTDPAWLFYTSGTTGHPKGVVLTHGNLLAMALNYLADVDHATVGDHLLHAAPMSHGSGLYTIPNVAVGATQLIPASCGFDAAEIEHIIAFTPHVKFFAAPTMVMRLVDAWRGEREPANLKSIIYGGGPMYVADCLRALECFGPRLVQIYGQGEAPMTITVLPASDHIDDHDGHRLHRLGSVGRAQTGVEVAVLNANDQRVAVGELGEVCVRGEVVMAGYLNDPEATAQTLANGWLHTGDVGRLDEHGYVTLVDRSKDLIISGGSNIYPREVEEVLLMHPAVKEAAVLGERDEKWGESVVAVLVKREGHIPDEHELDLFCLEHIARFKRPKRYVFVEQLPRNATGKVLKRELRLQLTPTARFERQTGVTFASRSIESSSASCAASSSAATTTATSWLTSTGPKFAVRASSSSTSITRLSWPRVIARNTSASRPASSNAPCNVRCALDTA